MTFTKAKSLVAKSAHAKSAPIVSSSYQVSSGNKGPANKGDTFYFCVPQNDILLGYWDTVGDRLFKVRNCMNIEGVVRQLPLFAPPIDPALLVRAVAMGVDLSSVLNNINAATPRYRFIYVLQKALELCADVKALGSALLGALEKKDAEVLAAMRAGQEMNLLKAVKTVKEQQIEEVHNTLDGLGKFKDLAEIRHAYYTSRPFMNEGEIAHLVLSASASVAHAVIEGIVASATVAYATPTVTVGSAGFSSPVSLSTTVDGNKVGPAGLSVGKAAEIVVGLMREGAAISATLGGYQQRADERKLQADLAAKDKEQIEKQIAAATIRLAITGLELDNHKKQIENALATEEFLRNKYTNDELYGWMITQISAVFFQSYQLAYDLAKRAERAFQFERGLTTSDYIHFGYWDSRRSGLLAGEQLHLDLKRLELAYLDQNKRDYEISKHISLMFNSPMALISLKETGQCTIDLPEAFFDADYPGHYMRRIKNVTLTIPCVTGPYTSINCTLTLLKSSIRHQGNPTGTGNEYARDEQDDARFVDNFSAVESIATSHAQNDSGMFELNFRDERYLPFEGAGAVSTWRLEMPKDTNAFDFQTISDVILKLSYTARDGGKPLQTAARNALGFLPWTNPTSSQAAPGLLRMFSLKHEFPTEWFRFLNPMDSSSTTQSLPISLSQERFSFLLRGKTITLTAATLFLKIADSFVYEPSQQAFTFHLKQNSQPGEATSFETAGSPVNGLPCRKVALTALDVPANLIVEVFESELPSPNSVSPKTWWQSVEVNGVNHSRLKPDAIEDIWVICEYSAL